MSHEEHIRFVNFMDQELWDEIDPREEGAVQRIDVTKPRWTSRKKVKSETESDDELHEKLLERKKALKRAEKTKKGIPIKNNILSLSSFLVPIYVTGEKPDYKLLYCINAIRTALKFASTNLRKEGFAQLYMVGMKSKLNWEEIKSNSSPISDIITSIILKSGAVCMVAANKSEDVKKVHSPDAPFIVLLSATDIETPCRGNQCVGTGWIVFRRTHQSHIKGLFDREILKCGRRGVAAGVLVNGCSTSSIIAFKKISGIHHFVFDCRIGDLILYEAESYIRTAGKALSFNEGLFFKLSKKIQDWLMNRKNCSLPEEEYYSRYTGGWFTDSYKILISGGLYMSPREMRRFDGHGRIKLLYEAFPIAFLTEMGGGRATDGNFPILKRKPFTKLQMTHLFMGSLDEVNNIMEVLKEETQISRYFSKHECHDTDETSTDYE